PVARRDPEVRAATAQIAKERNVQTVAIRADLQQKGESERAVEAAVQAFGALDILVANAGGPKAGHFSELSDEDWEAAFQLTYLSTSRLMRAAIPHMKKAGWGRIVVIGSRAADE